MNHPVHTLRVCCSSVADCQTPRTVTHYIKRHFLHYKRVQLPLEENFLYFGLQILPLIQTSKVSMRQAQILTYNKMKQQKPNNTESKCQCVFQPGNTEVMERIPMDDV